MQWIIPLHYLLMWYSLMKVKLPRLCCRHVINCQEMAVWNTLYVGHGDVSVKETRKKRILPWIINKAWLLLHLLLSNLLLSKFMAFGGATSMWSCSLPSTDQTISSWVGAVILNKQEALSQLTYSQHTQGGRKSWIVFWVLTSCDKWVMSLHALID